MNQHLSVLGCGIVTPNLPPVLKPQLLKQHHPETAAATTVFEQQDKLEGTRTICSINCTFLWCLIFASKATTFKSIL
jgi:hypothetical protein